METFSDFLERIHAFEYPSFHLEHDVFQPPLTLADKVRPDGSYRRFTGDTILYWLDQQTQKTLSIWQDSLYACAGALLSDKLNNAQMHVTLHDLSLGQPEKLCHYAKKQLSELKQEPISMRMTVVFPLAATALPSRWNLSMKKNIKNGSLAMKKRNRSSVFLIYPHRISPWHTSGQKCIRSRKSLCCKTGLMNTDMSIGH